MVSKFLLCVFICLISSFCQLPENYSIVHLNKIPCSRVTACVESGALEI